MQANVKIKQKEQERQREISQKIPNSGLYAHVPSRLNSTIKTTPNQGTEFMPVKEIKSLPGRKTKTGQVPEYLQKLKKKWATDEEKKLQKIEQEYFETN